MINCFLLHQKASRSSKCATARLQRLMAQVQLDIFNKDAVVQVFGVARGVAPTELVGPDAECVGIVMRLEVGGCLESWLHDPQGRGAQFTVGSADGLAERLRNAIHVARGRHIAGLLFLIN